MKIINIAFSISAMLLVMGASAQDTTKRKTIEITSSFKPSLKPSAKVDFNPSAVGSDTVRPRLTYRVPIQNPSFQIYPASLKPAAIQPDTSSPYANSGYAKVGYGNFNTPYAAAAISFGDGRKSSGALQGNFISSKGKLTHQQYAKYGITGDALFAAGENSKLKAGASLEGFNTRKYGYQPDTLKFSKDQVFQRFTTFNVNAELSNNTPTEFGLTYAPAASLWFFTDNNGGREGHFHIKAPLEKSLAENLKFGVDFQADLVNYKGKVFENKNNLYSITPSITWANEVLVLKAGIMPSWDNGAFKLLPDVELEAKVPEQPFMAIAGFKGYYDINSYRSMAGFNPWIAQPINVFNTCNSELYVGLKGNSGEHLSYMARVGYVHRNNVALFLNDSSDGKTYRVTSEPTINSIRLQGEVSYQKADAFYWNAGIKVQTFGSMKINKEAYGLIPVEINSHVRAKIAKDFYFTADLFYFEGNHYKTKAATGRTKVAIDMNAGLEFKVANNIGLWVQFNNLFNSQYQRWKQYQVLGFQALGGVKFNF